MRHMECAQPRSKLVSIIQAPSVCNDVIFIRHPRNVQIGRRPRRKEEREEVRHPHHLFECPGVPSGLETVQCFPDSNGTLVRRNVSYFLIDCDDDNMPIKGL